MTATSSVLNVIGGDGITANANDIAVTAAQTTITSLLATDIKIGEDAETVIDFETANEIHFDADNAERVKIDSTGLNIVSGSLETATIDYTDGDLAMTIADGGGVTFAQAVDLGANTLTTTGSLQVRTIDYSDGDLAITIADGGGVTFAQTAIFSWTIDIGDASASSLSGSGGELSVEGSVVKKVGLEDMWIPAAAMTPTESGGCADIESVETTADRPDLRVLDFDTSSVEKAQFQVVFPKSWDAGTVTFTAYWTASSTNTGTVCWALAGISMGDNDSIDVAFPTPTNATAKAHSGTVEDLNISATSGDVTITAAADNELVFFELSRQTGSDTYNADARLIGIKLHYTTEASTDA